MSVTDFSLRLVFPVLTSALVACGGGGGSTPTAPGGPSTPAPSVGTVTVSGSATAELGTTTQLTAQVRDAAGAVVTGGTVTWTSSDQSVASVSASGVVSAIKIGPVTITATSGSASGTFTFTGTLAPYSFNFGGVASASDQRLIMDGVLFADTYFRQTLGRTLTQPTTVSASTTAAGCASGGSAAFTGGGAVTFCVSNQGWTVHGPINRQKIAIHELFHVLQFEMRWLGVPATGAEWIIEGGAEYIAFQVIAGRGLLGFDTALGCMVKEVADFAQRQPPGLPNLQQLEGRQQFVSTQGPLYALSMLGMHQLVAGTTTRIRTFGESMAAGTQFPEAFMSAFGRSRLDFYGQWPAHLAGLSVPASYACGV